MAKIVFIGAGSIIFARTLLVDILSLEELKDLTISLMDIDQKRLELTTKLAQRFVQQERLPTTVESTLNRKEALSDADYVITMIQAGDLNDIEKDLTIPLKYGVDQCVGDTLGPGGVMRAFRIIPALTEICQDMGRLCPQALLMNYSNPMAINCLAINQVSKIKNVGLCHSVQRTTRELASYIGAPHEKRCYWAPHEEISCWVAGINHMAWFLEFRWGGKDAYPLLREAMKKKEIYEKDPVRFEIFRHFDYFVTESSGHMSEYIPYIRKRKDLIDKFCRKGALLGESRCWMREHREREEAYYEEVKRQIAGEERIETRRSDEYASVIIHSMETGEVSRINGNVLNTGLITNLPYGSCVEVPCLVDETGIRPCYIGELPAQLAALNCSNINMQRMAVKAAISKDKHLAFQAVALDPLTASVCSLDEIKKMVDELFEAEKESLPETKR